MVASGNDFVVVENHRAVRLPGFRVLAKMMCDRKFGIGADGLLVLEKSKSADVKMRIFNADGSEAQMCGNGARCVALFKLSSGGVASEVNIETKAGIIVSRIKGDCLKIKLTPPRDISLDIPILVNNRRLRVNFINTGVPHAVIFVQGLDKIDVAGIGRGIRYHKQFAPAGTNVNFVEILDKDAIKIRTYERGVEDETLACGTGSTAAALITSLVLQEAGSAKIKVLTKSGETLKVYFKRLKDKFNSVWLEGKAKIVYKGEYYV